MVRMTPERYQAWLGGLKRGDPVAVQDPDGRRRVLLREIVRVTATQLLVENRSRYSKGSGSLRCERNSPRRGERLVPPEKDRVFDTPDQRLARPGWLLSLRPGDQVRVVQGIVSTGPFVISRTTRSQIIIEGRTGCMLWRFRRSSGAIMCTKGSVCSGQYLMPKDEG